MIAAAHLPAALTVSVAAVIVVVIVWYWVRLGAESVPASRRWIRRSSMIVMLVGLPILVAALSFVDYKTQQGPYVICWLAVLFCLALVLLGAAVDILDTLRLSRLERHRIFLDAAAAAALARQARHEDKGADA